MTLGKNGNIYYLLQFPREVLIEAPRFMLMPTFPLRFLVFQWGNWIVSSSKSLFPLIILLQTENIPSFWLDQEVNSCFCIYDHFISLNLTSLGDLWFDAIEPRYDTGFNVTGHKGECFDLAFRSQYINY